jgi:hypothetical protein
VLAEVESWAAEFERLCERIGPRFARSEVRRRAAGFLRGLQPADDGEELQDGPVVAAIVGLTA